MSSDLVVLSRPGGVALLADAERLAAQVELGAGDPAAARRHAQRAASVTWETPAAGAVPPEYARLEDECRTERARLAPRPVRVTSQPAGALVLIDGLPSRGW